MINQQIEQSDFDNRPTTEIPPSQRVYAFKDLPPQTKESLLRLQNTDGDFLKSSSGETGRRIVLLILTALAAVGLSAIVADSLPDTKRIVVFSADALILSVWFIYFVWEFFKTLGSLRRRTLSSICPLSKRKFSGR